MKVKVWKCKSESVKLNFFKWKWACEIESVKGVKVMVLSDGILKKSEGVKATVKVWK